MRSRPQTTAMRSMALACGRGRVALLAHHIRKRMAVALPDISFTLPDRTEHATVSSARFAHLRPSSRSSFSERASIDIGAVVLRRGAASSKFSGGRGPRRRPCPASRCRGKGAGSEVVIFGIWTCAPATLFSMVLSLAPAAALRTPASAPLHRGPGDRRPRTRTHVTDGRTRARHCAVREQ